MFIYWANQGPEASDPSTQETRRHISLLAVCLQALKLYCRRHSKTRVLEALNDNALKDIGVHRCEI